MNKSVKPRIPSNSKHHRTQIMFFRVYQGSGINHLHSLIVYDLKSYAMGSVNYGNKSGGILWKHTLATINKFVTEGGVETT